MYCYAHSAAACRCSQGTESTEHKQIISVKCHASLKGIRHKCGCWHCPYAFPQTSALMWQCIGSMQQACSHQPACTSCPYLGGSHDVIPHVLRGTRERLLVVVFQQPPEGLGQRLALLHARCRQNRHLPAHSSSVAGLSRKALSRLVTAKNALAHGRCSLQGGRPPAHSPSDSYQTGQDNRSEKAATSHPL